MTTTSDTADSGVYTILFRWKEICFTIFLLTVLYYCYLVLKWYLRILKIGKQVDKFPGLPKHWLFGNLHQIPFMTDGAILTFATETLAKFNGGTYRQWFGPFRPGVVLAHPENVKSILKSLEPKSTAGNGPYGQLRAWLGDGLLISKGEKWHRNRRLLTPAFHFDVLKEYVRYYNEAADILMEKWEENLHQNADSSIEIYADICLCTLDIILRCAFSCEIDVQRQGQNNTYVKNVLHLSEMIVTRSFNLLWYIDWYYFRTSHGKKLREMCDQVHSTADEIINKRRQQLKENPDIPRKRCLDFLDILLLAKDENNVGLTHEEIRNEVDTFLFEGHDTTASAVTFCLYNLASHPEYQQRAQEEIDAMYEKKHDGNLEWDDISELQYLTQCIRESLRHSPPVPFIVRDLENPFEVDGVTLLPGTILDIAIWSLHHNAKVWGEDHLEYKPERFELEKMKELDSHAFIPFSAGPRNCIGQNFAMHELKVVLAKLLHRFSFEVDETHKVIKVPELVLRPKNGIKLKVTRRS